MPTGGFTGIQLPYKLERDGGVEPLVANPTLFKKTTALQAAGRNTPLYYLQKFDKTKKYKN